MSNQGFRNLAVAITKNAYSDYWDHYLALRRAEEQGDKDLVGSSERKLQRIERFFASEWYNEILCGIAPMLCRLKFKEFLQRLPAKYEEFKIKGKKGCSVDSLFLEISNA